MFHYVTLNQRVPGSSPGAPTKLFRHLASQVAQQADLILQVILQFCSRFELEHRSFGELNVATEIVRVEDGLDVLQRVAGYGSDLRYARAGNRQPNNRRAAQVVKCEAADASALASFRPRCAKPIGRPGPAQRIRQYEWASTLSGVEQGPQGRASRHRDAPTTFGLPQANIGALVG